MIYRGPVFLTVVSLPFSKLYTGETQKDREKRYNLLTGGEGVKRVGE
jgi:hypothetical protein